MCSASIDLLLQDGEAAVTLAAASPEPPALWE